MPNTVLITGSNRGLGLGFVKYYLNSASTIIACCRNPGNASELVKLAARNNNLRIYPLDLADESSIEQIACQTEDLNIDLLINNAGVSQPLPFDNWDKSYFQTHLDTNLIGPALLSQKVASNMATGSKVIQIGSGRSSLAWNQSPTDELDAYGISKAALNMLMRRISAKLASKNITTITISPGWVQTDTGGTEATLTVAESVNLMCKVIHSVSLQDSGSFYAETGEIIPW